MSYIWTTFFYQPVLNLVILIYNYIPGNDLAITIVVFAALVKLLLLPLSKKQLKSQKKLQDLQPKIEELKKKHKDNKEALSRETLKLYQENKVNPFSACGTLIIQLPFLIAIFRVFRDNFSEQALSLVYPFVERPETINSIGLGFIDLAHPNVYIAIAAGLAQFWQGRLMAAKTKKNKDRPAGQADSMMAIMNKQMLFMMPALTVFIGLSLPGGLTLYWFVTTLLTALQQVYLFKKKEKDTVIEGEAIEVESKKK